MKVAYRETITARGRGRGQVQEADRRSRAVRRRVRAGRAASSAAAASSSSTRSSAARSPASSSPRSRRASHETMEHGGVFGFPVVDVKVTCFDGKYHSVDSSEMSFKMAGLDRLQGGDGEGRRRSCSSRSASSSSSRPRRTRATSWATSTRSAGASRARARSGNGEVEIVALVPTSEVLRYTIDLRSMTGGRGRFTASALALRPGARAPGRQGAGGRQRGLTWE